MKHLYEKVKEFDIMIENSNKFKFLFDEKDK